MYSLPDRSFHPGDRVRISAVREVGSARLLDGLFAEVVGPHPVATDWYKIRLDENDVTPYLDWSAPRDRLRLVGRNGGPISEWHPFPPSETVKHYP